MFVVIVEQWADNTPWHTDFEVFTNYAAAEEYSQQLQGLQDSSWGLEGEYGWIQSVSLDGTAACPEADWIWHLL